MKITTKIKAERMLKHLEKNKIYHDEIEEKTLTKLNRLEGLSLDEAEAEILLAEIYDEVKI